MKKTNLRNLLFIILVNADIYFLIIGYLRLKLLNIFELIESVK